MLFKTLLNGTVHGVIECANITHAQAGTISLLVDENDYIDIQNGAHRVFRTRKVEGAYHWAHPNHTFNVHPSNYTI